MFKIKVTALLLAAIASVSCCQASTYYVDAVGGNDASAGTTVATAWKTLQKASTAQLMPGDKLLFRAGDTFAGHLAVEATGTPQARTAD